jgi:hypothetical protein
LPVLAGGIAPDGHQLACAAAAGGQFWSVFVPVQMQGAAAVQATLEQIDIVRQMAGAVSAGLRARLYRRRRTPHP